jgi:hypothetical protein
VRRRRRAAPVEGKQRDGVEEVAAPGDQRRDWKIRIVRGGATDRTRDLGEEQLARDGPASARKGCRAAVSGSWRTSQRRADASA